MPLILAIEPDRDQAAQLQEIADSKLNADLVLAETTELALEAVGNRVPDLVLVPALLSPGDDAALAAALRVIATAAHVRTLTIPAFAAPRSRGRIGGLFSKFRRNKDESGMEGCDPAVFADQISAYLAEAAADRETMEPSTPPLPVAKRVTAAPLPVEPAPAFPSIFKPAETKRGKPAFDPMFDKPEPGFVQTSPEPEPIVVEDAAPAYTFEAAPELLQPAEPIEPEREPEAQPDFVPPRAAAPAFEKPVAKFEPPIEKPIEHAIEKGDEIDLGSSLSELAASEPDPDAIDIDPISLEEFSEAISFDALFEESKARAAAPLIDKAPPAKPAPAPAPPVAAAPRPAPSPAPKPAPAPAAKPAPVPVAKPAPAPAAKPAPAPVAPPPPPMAAKPSPTPFARPMPIPIARPATPPRPRPVPAAARPAAAPPSPVTRPVAVPSRSSAPAMTARDKVVDPRVDWTPLPVAAMQAWPKADGGAADAARNDRAEKTERTQHVEKQHATGWTELVESLRLDIERRRHEKAQPAAAAVPPEPAAPRKKRQQAPVQDEWGFFDPEQCGFAALLAKLDELTDNADEP